MRLQVVCRHNQGTLRGLLDLSADNPSPLIKSPNLPLCNKGKKLTHQNLRTLYRI